MSGTLDYAPISPDLPLYDATLHTQRTRKWPLTPSSPPVPTGSGSGDKAATRARPSSAATTPIVGTPGGDPRRSETGTEQVFRLPIAGLRGPCRPSYSRYVRRRKTAAPEQGRDVCQAEARSRHGADRAYGSTEADRRRPAAMSWQVPDRRAVPAIPGWLPCGVGPTTPHRA